MVQTELAGEAQNFRRFTGNRQHDRQRVFRHITGHREVGIVNMVAEFADVREKTRAIFGQRSGGACANKNNALRGQNDIRGFIQQLIKFIVIHATEETDDFAGAEVSLLGFILLKVELKADAKLGVAVAVKLAAKAQHRRGGNACCLGQLTDGHIHHFVAVFDHKVIDPHFDIIKAGNGGMSE